jgi:hypothetical protein
MDCKYTSSGDYVCTPIIQTQLETFTDIDADADYEEFAGNGYIKQITFDGNPTVIDMNINPDTFYLISVVNGSNDFTPDEGTTDGTYGSYLFNINMDFFVTIKGNNMVFSMENGKLLLHSGNYKRYKKYLLLDASKTFYGSVHINGTSNDLGITLSAGNFTLTFVNNPNDNTPDDGSNDGTFGTYILDMQKQELTVINGSNLEFEIINNRIRIKSIDGGRYLKYYTLNQNNL